MSETVYKSPGSTVSVDRGSNYSVWSNPGNVVSSDDYYASSVISSQKTSDWIKAYNFNLGIPTGATIVGIEVKIERKSEDYGMHRDEHVELAVGDSGKGSNYADTDGYYLIGDSIATYPATGGSTDLWGTTWSVSDINNLSVFYTVANDGCCSKTCYVDHIQVKVWYTTTVVIPTLTTQAVDNISDYSARGWGTITNTGGEDCTKRGVCWNTTGTPTIANDKSEELGSFTTGIFSRSMTGLSPGTHFYVRSYAYNSAGYGYGNEVQFDSTGATVVVPTVTTQAVDNIMNTTATGNGNITATGGEDCTQGICWDTSSGPTAGDSHVENAGTHGTGVFTGSMTALAPGTHYYVKAYAYNSAGYSYGAEVEFDTTGSGSSCIGGGNYPDSGTEVARSGSTGSWTGETNICAYDSNRADWSAAADGYSPWLKAADFGLNIPYNATIDGIQIEIRRHADGASELKDSSVRLAVSGSLKGDDKAYTAAWWPTSSDVCIAYGALDNLWGTTWTPADINNLEVYLSVARVAAGATHGFVNYIKVRVWYTEGEEEHNAVFFGANF